MTMLGWHTLYLIILFITVLMILGQRSTINRLLKKQGFNNIDEAFPPNKSPYPTRDFEIHLMNGTVVTIRADKHECDGDLEWFETNDGFCMGQFLAEDVRYWTAKLVEDPKLDDPETWRGIGEEASV